MKIQKKYKYKYKRNTNINTKCISPGGNQVDEYMRVRPHVILPNWLHLPPLVYLVKEGGEYDDDDDGDDDDGDND